MIAIAIIGWFTAAFFLAACVFAGAGKKSAEEKYVVLMQSHLQTNAIQDRTQTELDSLKQTFESFLKRPNVAFITDQQVVNLSSAVAGMVSAQLSRPDQVN